MSRGPLRRLLPPGAEFKIGRRPPRLLPALDLLLRRLGVIARRPEIRDAGPLLRTEQVERVVDVLVVGGGAAGIAAAEAAAAAGRPVLLAERAARLGGVADGYDGFVDGMPVTAWLDGRIAGLRGRDGVTILTGAAVTVLGADGAAFILDSSRLWRVAAKAVVLATGAAEKPLVFPGNDRAGVMLAAAARLGLRCRGVRPGRRVVIATTGDEGYRAALDLAAAGVAVERIVDLRLDPESATAYVVRSHGIRMAFGSAPVAVLGSGRLSAVVVANRFTVDGVALRHTIPCDALLVSGGFSPELRLAAQAGAALAFDAGLGAFTVIERPDWLFVGGAAGGRGNLSAALDDGWHAGAAAASSLGAAPPPAPVHTISVVADPAAEAVPLLPDPATPAEEAQATVDLANGVRVRDVAVALHEGFRSPRQLARYVRLGRGGADAATATLAAAAVVRLGGAPGVPDGWAETALVPIPLAALARAGSGIPPAPARAFPRPGEEVETAIRREVAATRATAGLFDLSTCGRIAVGGPDAQAFLDRVLATDLGVLTAGSAAPAVALDPFGFVHFAGDLAAFSPMRFVLNTAPEMRLRCQRWFTRWAAEWHDLDVSIADETSLWSAAWIGGAAAPSLLRDIADDAGSRPASGLLWRGHVGGAVAWAVPHAATGEPAVEIVIATAGMSALWRRLAGRVADAGGAIVGTGAWERLHLEAGVPDPVRDGGGVTTAADLGLGTLVAADKGDFVGRDALARPALAAAGRPRLVGLLLDGSDAPSPGTLLLAEPAGEVVGRVTRSGHSPTARRPIALGLVADGPNRAGDRVAFRRAGEWRWAAIVMPQRLGLSGSRRAVT
ncbi:MAG TPA: FAD-dependent oxidoreductase [Hyphomicrobiales bacterium]|nr:FAD-dependent oxidoreductase [Hyphomicrobiales bacterium]